MFRSVLILSVLFLIMNLPGTGTYSFVSSAHAASYGCYKIVDASSVRVRSKPYLWAKTLTYAKRGQKVVKNRKFCSIRGTWCRVQVKDTSGWIGKKYLEKVDC